MAGKTITSANTVITLAIAGLFTVPQRLVAFAADDIFGTDEIQPAEVMMGVDGRMSAGFVNREVPWNVMFQGDSPSVDMFETWVAAQKAAQDLFTATGAVTFPSLSKSYAMTKGVLTRYSSMSDAKKVIQPRRFQITWESVDPAST